MTLNALSVDLEEYFQVSNFTGLIERSRWDALPSRVADATRRLLDAIDATGNRATFFVLGWVAERHPELVREIAARGHEIACHGYGHELVYELGPERFRADLRRARAAIEQATGSAGATATGRPSYSITEASLWALRILVEEGFRYDSSIFPIRHHRYGIPGFARRPVRIELGDGSRSTSFRSRRSRRAPGRCRSQAAPTCASCRFRLRLGPRATGRRRGAHGALRAPLGDRSRSSRARPSAGWCA